MLQTRCGIYLALVLATSTFFIGCGKQGGVTGSVTYNGQPVEFGTISFTPVDGRGPVFGGKIENGKFTVEPSYPGNKVVSVRGIRQQVLSQTREEAMKELKSGSANLPDYIPEDAQGNGQEMEISEGGQTIDIVITGPPRT